MTSDPAEVGHAAELVVGVNVEDVLDGHCSAEEEATNGVHDALWLASGARSLQFIPSDATWPWMLTETHVKNEQRVFRREESGRAEVGDLGGLLVPPLVTALYKVDRVASPLEDEDVLDARAVLDSVVRELLDRDRLSATTTLIGSDDDARLAVIDAVAERFRREASENYGVDGTNTCAGEEGSDGLPGHGKVDGDCVALLDAVGLEHVRDAADLAEELAVADLSTFTWLIGLVDDSGLAGLYENVHLGRVEEGVTLSGV